MEQFRSCVLCPRRCGARRLEGKRGLCGETAELRVASASIHRGEEPPLTGRGGSGAVFVSGCTLGCVFCQNYQISRTGMGRPVSQDELVGIFFALKERGAVNINIVTGSHAVPALRDSLAAARRAGLELPVLWNSSAYENPEALLLLRDTVDVWLPDLKTLDTELAAFFFRAPDYPEAAEKAILTMLDLQNRAKYRDEIMQKGVIIRHLVLPAHLENTRQVIRWFADHAQGRALLSVMTQYTPPKDAVEGAAPDRFVNRREYETVLNWLAEYGVEDGFYQELVQDSEWLPDFNRANPFSSELSVPVWHWRNGFVYD